MGHPQRADEEQHGPEGGNRGVPPPARDPAHACCPHGGAEVAAGAAGGRLSAGHPTHGSERISESYEPGLAGWHHDDPAERCPRPARRGRPGPVHHARGAAGGGGVCRDGRPGRTGGTAPGPGPSLGPARRGPRAARCRGSRPGASAAPARRRDPGARPHRTRHRGGSSGGARRGRPGLPREAVRGGRAAGAAARAPGAGDPG